MKTELNQLILKYNQQLPRYTSYPTAPQFTDKVNGDVYASWLRELTEEATISLYLHIPFCPQLCWYCGCHTKITKRYAPVENYTHLLKKEIRVISGLLQSKHLVSHIHFGGGSPSILSPNDFSVLMKEIRDHFTLNEQTEIAIELDPREVTQDKVATYAKEGVNRASIGVQDFHIDVQKAINREQSFDTIYESVKLLRDHSIDHINLDLIYGLPKQTLESLKENISYSLLLKPNRIALFGYAHVPWMKKHMRLIDESTLPGSDERFAMFQIGLEQYKKAGYIPIGLDHFVRAGDSMEIAMNNGTLRRNFQGYTIDNADALIGLGVSSIGRLPQGYIQNTPQNSEYEKAIMGGLPATFKGFAITEEDKLRQKIIEQLMCKMEVNIPAICKASNIDAEVFDEVIKSLNPLAQDNLITIENGIITINAEARQMVRFVCAAFDQYHTVEKKSHSQVS